MNIDKRVQVNMQSVQTAVVRPKLSGRAVKVLKELCKKGQVYIEDTNKLPALTNYLSDMGAAYEVRLHLEPDDKSDNFVASGGRDDPQGGDWALKDRIHDINERQRRYIQNAKYSYRYDPREQGSAAPTIYSPEAELQDSLYA